MFRPIQWLGDKLLLIDQTRLPREEIYLELKDYKEVAEAIKEMRVRGAPALGVAGAYGLALGAQTLEAQNRDEFLVKLREIVHFLSSTRPTAVNLSWALTRLVRRAEETQWQAVDKLRNILVAEAIHIQEEEEEADRRMGQMGASLIQDGFQILTHCNTGALATGGFGTALAVIFTAAKDGKKVHVFVDETRPLLQGARLTAWELAKAGVPATLITDNMAGHFMHRGKVDCVIVGADRIAANGDVANKIGTYTLAVLAKENGVPFYVVAPTSTIDLSLPSGDGIPIEERKPEEVTHINGVLIAPSETPAANPAFDVTPARYVTAIITEGGIVREPYEEGLKKICTQSE